MQRIGFWLCFSLVLCLSKTSFGNVTSGITKTPCLKNYAQTISNTLIGVENGLTKVSLYWDRNQDRWEENSEREDYKERSSETCSTTADFRFVKNGVEHFFKGCKIIWRTDSVHKAMVGTSFKSNFKIKCTNDDELNSKLEFEDVNSQKSNTYKAKVEDRYLAFPGRF